MVKEINSEKEFIAFTEKDKVVIDFWAEWCFPCQIMSKIINRASKKFKNIKFAKVNVDENKNLASKFNISKIPTLFFFKKGKLIERISRVIPEEEFEDKLKNL